MDTRNDPSGYYFSRRYSPEMSPVVVPDDSEDLVESEKKPGDSLLSIIYAPDVRTGLPTGDLSYYVSDKANPQVKQFILDNLLRDVSAAAAPSLPDGVSEDLAFQLMREKDEDIHSYMDRLNTTISQDKWLLDEYKKQNVSSRSEQPSVSDE